MNTKRYRIENFEWAHIPEDLPRENLVLAVAKTTKPTIHPEDTELPPIRIFEAKELYEAARSLARRPVGLNHRTEIQNAFTVDANWNDKDKCVEALLYLPISYVQKIKEGIITQVSVEYNWRKETIDGPKVTFHDLVFYRVDLLEGLNAGDNNTWLRAVESENRGEIQGEIKLPCDKKKCDKCGQCGKEASPEIDIKQDEIQASIDKPSLTFFKEDEYRAYESEFARVRGEPFAGYKDFADCVAKNKDKGNPDAYCGYIKHKVEDPKKEALGPSPEKGMNPMANDPISLEPANLPIGKIGIVPQLGECKEELNKDVMNTKGVNIKVTDEDKSKQRVESAANNNTTKLPEAGSKGKEAVPPTIPEPIEHPMPVAPVPIPEVPVVKAPEATPAQSAPIMTPDVQKLMEAQAQQLKDKDAAIAKLQKTVQDEQTSKSKAVKEAVVKTRTEIISKVEAVLPDSNIVSGWNHGGQMLATAVRKVIYQEKKKDEK